MAPTSYTILPHRLTVEPNPTAEGRFGDVYQGTLDGTRVCIKRVRMYQSTLQEINEVRWWRHPLP
jgi:hypothetical protein